MQSVIRVENLSKQYRLGSEVDHSQSFREMLSGLVTAPVRRLRRLKGTDDKIATVWALKDISFDVKEGEIVGIVGRNGAGKSTLLKLLSRITTPTSGEISYHGKLTGLLEVGTGFHPELTGRENIFLNGAILGMSRTEIQTRLDEIVAFAEVDQFLDTPVKRYSSGMLVRLAFSVSAHLEPDILVIDEVLAVGDVDFQKKSIEKMRAMAANGSAVLFTSHNMSMIQSLTTRCLLLHRGQMQSIGKTNDVVNEYVELNRNDLGVVMDGDNTVEVTHFTATTDQTDDDNLSIEVTVEIKALQDMHNAKIDIVIDNDNGITVLKNVASKEEQFDLKKNNSLKATFNMKITRLLHGEYFGGIYIYTIPGKPFIHMNSVRLFSVAKPLHIAGTYSYDFKPIMVPDITSNITKG